MKTASAKAKGRRLQQDVAARVAEKLGLPPEDVRSTPIGVTGSDLTLSLGAMEHFPFDVESKNTERLDLWGAIKQVEKRMSFAKRLYPLVVFSRNRSEVYAALPLDALLDILAERKTCMSQS